MTTEHNTSRSGTDPLVWEPPGPGVWEVDADHQNEPRGRLFFDLFSESFRAGFADLFRRYGLPLEELRSAEVNGWHYNSAKAVGAPEKGGGGAPPALVLKIVSRLHPELRRRNRAAATALRERTWLQDAAAWERERAQWLDRSRRLDELDLSALDDPSLSDVASEAMQLSKDMMRRHFELQGPALAAGRLLAACAEWGLDRRLVLDLFAGASPASAATGPALAAIRDRLAERGVDPASVSGHEQLLDTAPEEVEAFMAEWGRRLLDDDLGGSTLADHPERLVDLVRSARPVFDADQVSAAARDELRASVPVQERDRFDELLADVRATYPTLDDNSGVTALVAGSAQRVLRELERRAIERGLLAEPGDLELLGIEEASSLLGDGTVVSLAEVARRREKLAAAASPPPPVLGGEVHPPPDPSVFPKPMAELTAAIGAYLAQKFGEGPSDRTPAGPDGGLWIDGERIASGHGLGDEVTARVVVARTASEAIDVVEPGVILVCPYTTPAWNVVFPMLAGIVTEVGSPLGHTGVMAREFGLPALLGIGDADPAWSGSTATLRP